MAYNRENASRGLEQLLGEPLSSIGMENDDPGNGAVCEEKKNLWKKSWFLSLQEKNINTEKENIKLIMFSLYCLHFIAHPYTFMIIFFNIMQLNGEIWLPWWRQW